MTPPAGPRPQRRSPYHSSGGIGPLTAQHQRSGQVQFDLGYSHEGFQRSEKMRTEIDTTERGAKEANRKTRNLRLCWSSLSPFSFRPNEA
ncbi:hypothetical protein B296_00037713 [Ensete ventricosum]|uniref:Uncharacterized protein n=1 Tax=Ensete ventricosum TaxID=4639 RepID=A0A426Y4D7_ENSVE|nr:hypothetical protein B296_00037713 [Ensete ventricosum]